MSWYLLICLLLSQGLALGVRLFGALESASLIGGRNVSVQDAEAKYMVSLQINNGEHFCGGGIIGGRYVLSAAHCFMSEMNEFYNDTITVVAGTNDFNKRLNNYKVEKIYVPANYTDSKWAIFPPFGDIAVLKLNESLDLKELTKLRLPRVQKSDFKSYVDKEALVSGFGWDKVSIRKTYNNQIGYERGASSGRLNKAKAWILSNELCRQLYPHPILESELCAKVVEHTQMDKVTQGVCRGDSGSPLVYKGKIIVGVLKGISLGCNENKEPGLYSRVSTYVQFIKRAFKDQTDNMQIKLFN